MLILYASHKIFSLIKMKDLDDVMADEFFATAPRWGGSLSRDEADTMVSGKFYLMNLDPEGGGTHWTLCYLGRKYGIYFDSFGVDPPQAVLKRMKELKKENIMNNSQFQGIRSNLCGYFCLYVASQLLKGRAFMTILDDFDQTHLNDNGRLVMKWFDKISGASKGE